MLSIIIPYNICQQKHVNLAKIREKIKSTNHVLLILGGNNQVSGIHVLNLRTGEF